MKLLDAINDAKTVYFTDRWHWDEIVQRNMRKDVSWEASARKYLALYDEIIAWNDQKQEQPQEEKPEEK